jgi:hypothetical protein
MLVIYHRNSTKKFLVIWVRHILFKYIDWVRRKRSVQWLSAYLFPMSLNFFRRECDGKKIRYTWIVTLLSNYSSSYEVFGLKKLQCIRYIKLRCSENKQVVVRKCKPWYISLNYMHSATISVYFSYATLYSLHLNRSNKSPPWLPHVIKWYAFLIYSVHEPVFCSLHYSVNLLAVTTPTEQCVFHIFLHT